MLSRVTGPDRGTTDRFALPEAKLGIMPGGSGTQTVTRAIGERRAKELVLTGAPFTAVQAREWGFERNLPGGRNGPLSIRQCKQSIHRGLQMSLADGLAFEIEAYNRLVPTEDRQEGVSAFNERRTPSFRGR